MLKNIEDIIIYEDKDIIVCHKPAGMAVQNSRIGAPDMESALMNYLAMSTKETGKMPYIGIVHRLDQPVEGVIVFAKNKKTAASLTSQLTKDGFTKEYLAVTDKMPEIKAGRLENYLKKDGRTNSSTVVSANVAGAKKSILDYEVLNGIDDARTVSGKRIFVRIILGTGRHHQIRVQMANAGMPLLGDRKYNSSDKSGYSLGLCSRKLAFKHPVSQKKMDFVISPNGNCFEGFIEK